MYLQILTLPARNKGEIEIYAFDSATHAYHRNVMRHLRESNTTKERKKEKI